MLDEALELGEELGTDGSVNHPVVAGKTDIHAQSHHDLTVFDDGLFDGGAD